MQFDLHGTQIQVQTYILAANIVLRVTCAQAERNELHGRNGRLGLCQQALTSAFDANTGQPLVHDIGIDPM